jgi:hypothetical protein
VGVTASEGVGEFVAVKVFEISGEIVGVIAMTALVVGEGEISGKVSLWVLLQLEILAATINARALNAVLGLKPASRK